MTDIKLLSFADFEIHAQKNEWICNDDFDTEICPDHLYFSIDTEAVSNELDLAATKILDALGVVAKDDVELRHIERNAFELRYIAHGRPKSIFFTGPAGVGKYSLLNALLNMAGLAKTGAKGDACTSVVVRYSAAAKHVTEGFSVTIHFLKPEVIKEFIAAHTKVYYQRQFSSPDPEDHDNEVESSEIKQQETARKFFSLVFGEDDFKYLFTPRTFADGSFQALCLEKSLEKLTAIGIDQQSFTKQLFLSNSEELQASIEGYVTDVDGKECYWHLVGSVEIKCPFSILRHNIEFVDSPGLGELNQMRMASTNRAKKNADLLCIIGDTDRIKANELIMDSAVQTIAQHGAEKLAIVATKTDVIVDQDVLQENGSSYKQARDILSWIKVKKNMAASQKLDRQFMRQLTRYENYVLRQMKEAFVLDRAKELRSQVPGTLIGLTDSNLRDAVSKIPVFNISSALYMRWAENNEFLFDQAPELSVEATGVPTLRRHLLLLAAEQNYKEYEAHAREFFPRLLAKIFRVINPNRTEGFKQIALAFVTTIEYAANEFDGVLTRFLEGLTQQTLDILLADRDHYLESLDQEAEAWRNIRFFTFRKMMREHGVLVPGASKVAHMRRGYNINRNIARILTPAFRSLTRHQKPEHVQMAEELHEVRKRINAMVVSQLDNAASDLQSIEEAKKLWAPKGLALTTPTNNLVARLNSMADSVGTLAVRESDYTSFIARQTADIFETVYCSRPQKIQKMSRKRKSSSNDTIAKSVYEKPPGVFARELLLKLFKEGNCKKSAKANGSDAESEPESDDESSIDIVEKIMLALDAMIQKRYKTYANDFVDGIKATMQEFLNEIQQLAPTEVEISEASQAARLRLSDAMGSLKKNCEDVQALVPRKE